MGQPNLRLRALRASEFGAFAGRPTVAKKAKAGRTPIASTHKHFWCGSAPAPERPISDLIAVRRVRHRRRSRGDCRGPERDLSSRGLCLSGQFSAKGPSTVLGNRDPHCRLLHQDRLRRGQIGRAAGGRRRGRRRRALRLGWEERPRHRAEEARVAFAVALVRAFAFDTARGLARARGADALFGAALALAEVFALAAARDRTALPAPALTAPQAV